MRNWEAFVRARLRLGRLTPEREARIVRELAAQLEDFYDAAIARGLGDEDADAHARAQITDWPALSQGIETVERPNARPRLERVADRVEATPSRGASMAADLLRDVRFAGRQLSRNPGFAAVAILTLGLGVGSTTAIFSVINGVLLRPLPYPNPDQLVRVHEVVPQYGRSSVAPATFLDWRQQSTVFDGMAAYDVDGATIAGSEAPERVETGYVSSGLFELLQVQPLLGRTFQADEDGPGASNVVVLGHGLWQRRFGGDPATIGRAVSIDGSPATIVGVMPPGFYFPSRAIELWTPLALDPANASRGGHYLAAVARLKPDTAVQEAEAEIKAISERLAREYPKASAGESAEVVLLHEQIVGQVRPALLTLLAAVALVVLIACANVANLLLVRAAIRGKELAIRTALGAARRRLASQMLVESLVLAMSGGTLGVALAYAAIEPIRTLSAGSVPRVNDVHVDTNVLLFALLVSVITGIVFGLVPAWRPSWGAAGEALKEGGRSSASPGTRRLRSGLLVGEVALSIVLLVSATLLLRSFDRLTNVDPGFRTRDVLSFRLSLPPATYPEEHHRLAFFDRLLSELRRRPQVRTAGLTQTLPMRGGYVLSFTIRNRPEPAPGEGPSANYRSVTPGYFEALGIRLVRGRLFNSSDRVNAPMTAVVDEAFVRRHFAAEDPIGQGIDIGNGTDGFYEIVGVVGDVHHAGLDATTEPTMYVPFTKDVFSSAWIVARATADPSDVSAVVRTIVRDLDPQLAVYSMGPLAEVLSESLAQRRFAMLLLVAFAASAVFLAAVGLYGVVAYTVSQRTQELGVRIAMGARPPDVLRMVLGEGMRLALGGVIAGLVAALWLARLVESMLFEVTPFDPVSYAITAVVLVAVALAACYVPARRATRVDPIVALRQE